jgi:hypothetical protein
MIIKVCTAPTPYTVTPPYTGTPDTVYNVYTVHCRAHCTVNTVYCTVHSEHHSAPVWHPPHPCRLKFIKIFGLQWG